MPPRYLIRLIPTLLIFYLSLTAVVRAERLPTRIFTSADGLGSSFVNCLMRDSRGFLWACTRDGLSRFDGSRFVTYQVGDKSAPPGIEQILETSKGIYWIATTGGLYRFDPNAAPVIAQDQSTNRPTLNAELVSDERGVLYEDKSGNLWLASNGLYRVIDKNAKPVMEKIELNLPPGPPTTFDIGIIYEGRDLSLWLGTSWGVVRLFPDGKEVFYSIRARANPSRSIVQDQSGRVWVGGVNGVYIIAPESRAELVK